MSISHLIILGIVLLVVIPPEKLPEVMRNVGRMLNDLRRSTSGVWDDLKKEAEFKPEDLLQRTAKPEVKNTNASQNANQTTASEEIKNESKS